MRKNISEVSAEMLLGYLYPELEDKWIARYEGTFYRNYNGDALSIDEEVAEVCLARDGFLKLLPQGILTQEDELRDGDFAEKYEALEKRRHLLEEAFLPFDTFSFRRRLRIERIVSQLLDTKLEYLLKRYFHYDITAETCPYVREAAALLPFISKWRADFGFVRNLLASLLHCEVEMVTGRYSESDSTRCWLPMVRYQLIMPGLETAAYRELNADLEPLRRFIGEWFIPFEVECEIAVKWHRQPFTLGKEMILNYNTELGD